MHKKKHNSYKSETAATKSFNISPIFSWRRFCEVKARVEGSSTGLPDVFHLLTAF